MHLKSAFLKEFNADKKRPQLHYNKIFPGEQMLEYIGTVPSNNCVTSGKNLFAQAFGEMKRVVVKCDANIALCI